MNMRQPGPNKYSRHERHNDAEYIVKGVFLEKIGTVRRDIRKELIDHSLQIDGIIRIEHTGNGRFSILLHTASA